MYNLIKQLFSQLTFIQRKKFFGLQILVIFMAMLELVGIASIAPFMAVVSDPEIIKRNEVLIFFYKLSEADNSREFLYILGFVVLFFLILSSLVSIITTWRLALFGSHIGTEISGQLYRHYMAQDWMYHTQSSSAQLTKQVATESARVAQGVIEPLMQMNSRLVVAIVISIGIIWFNPLVAIFGVLLFGSAYFILFKIVRTKLKRNGRIISKVMTERFRLLNEGFGGIKDILLYARSYSFITKFETASAAYARARGANIAIMLTPRYLIELIAFGSIISLILYLLNSNDQDISLILPTLSVYALAALKLLPALQQIYSGFAQVRGNMGAYESIMGDLLESQHPVFASQTVINGNKGKLTFNDEILLKDIEFSYTREHQIINKLNIRIPCKSIVGFVGPSGGGKSTVIDLILGLVEPSEGSLLVDNNIISGANKRLWQDLIGFVPQSIFLSEGTIAENVAFGIPEDEIDYQKVLSALKLAHMDIFVESLEHNIHTKVGERGVKLSGGQRQRIGIARALYNDPDVLVFDEATSALDGVTEKLIMEAIHSFTGKKTIILIAHRLQTIEKCDIIFYLDQGCLLEQGTYNDLMIKNSHFRGMTNNG